MEYKDVVESQLYELAEAKGTVFLSKWKFSFGKSDVFNKNQRYYPKKTFTSAVEALNTRIQKNPVPGMTDHPLGGGNTRLSDVSHVLLKTWMENGVAWAEAGILNTTRGKDTLKILKSNVPLGASLRGFGEVGSDGKVKPGLDIRSVDIVCDPSFGPDATITQANVIESYIAEEEFNEEDLKQVTDAMDELSDATVQRLQEMLEKDGGGDWSKQELKALPLYIKALKDNPKLPTFHEWYKSWQEKFAGGERDQYAINEELYGQSIVKNEERLAGSFDSANTLYSSRKRIEARQKEIDQALSGKVMTEKTVSRLYAEYVLAGGHLSRADWIREFGF